VTLCWTSSSSPPARLTAAPSVNEQQPRPPSSDCSFRRGPAVPLDFRRDLLCDCRGHVGRDADCPAMRGKQARLAAESRPRSRDRCCPTGSADAVRGGGEIALIERGRRGESRSPHSPPIVGDAGGKVSPPGTAAV
jgi:hypothetical protein